MRQRSVLTAFGADHRRTSANALSLGCLKSAVNHSGEAGLSRESLYKALGEQGNPSLDTVVRVARAVGMRFRLEEA
jgi:probable addiction module antidote protein